MSAHCDPAPLSEAHGTMLGLLQLLDQCRDQVAAVLAIPQADRPDWKRRDLEGLAYQLDSFGGLLEMASTPEVNLAYAESQGQAWPVYVRRFRAGLPVSEELRQRVLAEMGGILPALSYDQN